MSLVIFDDINLQFADQPIFRNATLDIQTNERVCLIGRNGAGKSTLFKLITGEQAADSGDIHYKPALRVSQLAQALPEELNETVHDYVAHGLVHLGQLINDYETRSKEKRVANRSSQPVV